MKPGGIIEHVARRVVQLYVTSSDCRFEMGSKRNPAVKIASIRQARLPAISQRTRVGTLCMVY